MLSVEIEAQRYLEILEVLKILCILDYVTVEKDEEFNDYMLKLKNVRHLDKIHEILLNKKCFIDEKLSNKIEFDLYNKNNCIAEYNNSVHIGDFEINFKNEPLTWKEGLIKLQNIINNGDYEEDDHKKADEILLRIINNDEITEKFEKIDKWYC